MPHFFVHTPMRTAFLDALRPAPDKRYTTQYSPRHDAILKGQDHV
nr:hypothetical protein [Acetobacter malorum]